MLRFFSLLQQKPRGSPSVGKKLTTTVIFHLLRTVLHTAAVLSVILTAPDFGDFGTLCNGVGHVIENTVVDSHTGNFHKHFALAQTFWLGSVKCQWWHCQWPVIGAHVSSENACIRMQHQQAQWTCSLSFACMGTVVLACVCIWHKSFEKLWHNLRLTQRVKNYQHIHFEKSHNCFSLCATAMRSNDCVSVCFLQMLTRNQGCWWNDNFETLLQS